MNPKSLIPCIALILAGAAPIARAAYPEFTGTKPNGGQRGTEWKLTVTGSRLADFESLMFFSPGFSVKSVDKVEDRKVDLTINVAPDVEPGNHLIRIRTKSGISHARQIFVGRFPNVDEKEPNTEFDSAQPIELNQTVEGLVTNEDVDYYKLSVKKGQRISLEIDGLRLGYTTFDPYISILDKDRFEKAFSDDTILHRQDGYCSFVAEYDGDYYVMVRESSYRGSGNSFYRLHVGSFMRPDVVYPAGGKIGSTVKVRFLDKTSSAEEDVKLPEQADPNYNIFSAKDPAPSGNPFRLVSFDNVLEAEPNNEQAKATAAATGEPIALNGIIDSPGDIDFFKVPLKKDQQVVMQVFAQSLGSPLDSVVNVYNEKGGSLGGNDDGGGRRRLDSKQTIKVPADGNYYIRITDHLERGGPNYVYRIEMVASQPELTFASPQYSVNDTHYRQFMAVPRGGRMALLENISRNNVGGDFKFEAAGLPAGVKLLTEMAGKDMPNMPLMFEAAADAPLGQATVPVLLKPADDKASQVTGSMRQEFDIVRAGNVVFYTEIENKLPIAVVEEAPYSLEIEKPAVTLVNNGLLNLKVTAKRKEGFKAPIRVLMVWRPPGVSSIGEQTIAEGQTECTFLLDANANAPAGTWKFTVMGEADAGGGRVYNASPFCEVTTGPAYLSAPAIPLTAVEQGKETVMVAKIEHLQPFEGEAHAEIVGVPDTIPIEGATITKDTKEVAFKVKTHDKSPIGKQGNLFVKVDVPVKGGTATHRIALGSVLRIDAPRKAPAAAPAKPVVAANKPAAAPAAAPAKPLSRLEQLRQEAAAAGGKH